MKKRATVVGLVLLVFISVFALFPSIARAADSNTLYVASSEENNIPTTIRVLQKGSSSSGGGGWWPGGGSWGPGGGSGSSSSTDFQLFLPGNANVAAVYLSWDGDGLVTVDGTSYASGECPIPPVDTAKAYTLWDGTTINITTYQGSAAVQTVYIEIDESQGTIAAMNNDGDHETTCTGTICIEGKWYTLSKMKGRGNVTWNQNSGKKPYNLTLDKKINWPGIDSEKTKKWSILSEPYDESLLGNRTGFDLAYQMGIGQDTTSADIWMNGEYLGCYTITPKTDSFVTKNGYMLEDDNYTEDAIEDGGDPQFRLKGTNATNNNGNGPRITVKKIGDNLLLDENGNVDESAANLRAVSSDIQAWMQDAWDAIRSETGYNSKGKYYTEYIDIESFAKMYLMHEYVKSFDVRAGSILFYRNGTGEDDLLYAGPLWDLDNAMGSTQQNGGLGAADNRKDGDRRSGEGDFISNLSQSGSCIYQSLGTHLDFMYEVFRQYQIYRDAFNNVPNVVDQLSADIAASAKMNHKKVTKVSNSDHTYNSQTTLGSGEYRQVFLATSSNGETVWENHVQNLHTYVSARSKWFNNNYNITYYGSETDGWVSLGGKYTLYIKDGEALQQGFAEWQGAYYYLRNFKVMKTGWAEADGKYYYIQDYKFMKEGWKVYGGKYYYFRDYTLLEEGWVSYGGKWYYIRNYLPVVSDWVEWEGKWYRFDAQGVCDYVYTPPATEPAEPAEDVPSEDDEIELIGIMADFAYDADLDEAA